MHEAEDKIDAYLLRFERYAENAGWNRDDYALGLNSLLTGRALEVYCLLPRDEMNDYDKLKYIYIDIEKETKDTSSVDICKMVTSLSAVDELNCTEKVEESELEDGMRSSSSASSDSSSYFDNSADLASMPQRQDEEPQLGKPGETIKQVSISPELASSQTKQLVGLIEKFNEIFF